jgi:hypothetical protein
MECQLNRLAQWPMAHPIPILSPTAQYFHHGAHTDSADHHYIYRVPHFHQITKVSVFLIKKRSFSIESLDRISASNAVLHIVKEIQHYVQLFVNLPIN